MRLVCITLFIKKLKFKNINQPELVSGHIINYYILRLMNSKNTEAKYMMTKKQFLKEGYTAEDWKIYSLVQTGDVIYFNSIGGYELTNTGRIFVDRGDITFPMLKKYYGMFLKRKNRLIQEEKKKDSFQNSPITPMKNSPNTSRDAEEKKSIPEKPMVSQPKKKDIWF